MTKFFNSDLADLAHQLERSPRRLRLEQIQGIERVLGLVEADKAYPYDFVCYHITKYRKRGQPTTEYVVPGKALISDLVTMGETISRKAGLSVAELGEPYSTQQEVADELDVSTKTVRRWRDRGLLGIRVVYEDGVNRLAFLASTLRRFKDQNKDIVAKGSSFKQLTQPERDRIVARARELRAQDPIKLHAASVIIGEEMSRAIETVRYTLRRYDEAHADTAVFAPTFPNAYCERFQAMWQCKEHGDSTTSIAQTFGCAAAEVERILRVVQVHEWQKASWKYIHNELFDAPDADVLILEAPEPRAAEVSSPPIPKDVPAYLKSLYLTPLLTGEQEQHLFRRYNYLKFKLGRALRSTDADELAATTFDALADLVGQIDVVKQRIVAANLRLVVSIARKHVGWSPNFFEIISDGNVSLMRAVEGFDFARGNKFSTYATWAIVKNYARTVPEEHYHAARFVTGSEETLHAAADEHTETVSAGDRRHVSVAIAAALHELTERERDIISHHFGLGTAGSVATLEQLGHRFGVTKERIRQIEQKALGRLRELLSPSLVEALAG